MSSDDPLNLSKFGYSLSEKIVIPGPFHNGDTIIIVGDKITKIPKAKSC